MRFALMAALLAGCTGPKQYDTCTDLGCDDGLDITITKASEWTAGTWTFQVFSGSSRTECVLTFPLDSATPVSCDRDNVVITATEAGVEKVQLTDTDVTTAGLTVLLDDDEVFEESWTLSWDTANPNGADCEPTCKNSEQTANLP